MRMTSRRLGLRTHGEDAAYRVESLEIFCNAMVDAAEEDCNVFEPAVVLNLKCLLVMEDTVTQTT